MYTRAPHRVGPGQRSVENASNVDRTTPGGTARRGKASMRCPFKLSTARGISKPKLNRSTKFGLGANLCTQPCLAGRGLPWQFSSPRTPAPSPFSRNIPVPAPSSESATKPPSIGALPLPILRSGLWPSPPPCSLGAGYQNGTRTNEHPNPTHMQVNKGEAHGTSRRVAGSLFAVNCPHPHRLPRIAVSDVVTTPTNFQQVTRLG